VEEWEHADTEGVSDIFEDDLIFCPRPTLPCHMKKRNVFSMRINAYTALVTFSTSGGGDSHTLRNKTPMVMLPPSSSGATGYISAATLGLFDQVRARGAKVVVISGCRYSTLMQRLQFLPSADAYVCESGGRIFYRDHNGVALWEDVGWRYRMKNSGQIDALRRCMKACRARFAKMRGVKVDDDSYSTAFRVRSDRDAKSGIDIKSAVLKVVRDQKLEDELSVSVNLGCVDVYPKLSGKRNAAAYVADVFGGWELGEHAAFFCDDDNDIELAMEANRVFMPGMSENLAAAVMAAAKSKDRVHEKFRFFHDTDFTTYRNQPFRSTETLLLYLLKELDAQLDQRRPICLAKGVADRDQLDEGGLGYCQCCGKLQCKDKAGAHGEEAPSLGTLALMM
jgi:hydroxymethylpyrimidine pyrophosphatase-like HAD family hydrolase